MNKKDKKQNKKKKHFFKILILLFIIIIFYTALYIRNVFDDKNIKVYEVTMGEIVNVDRHRGFIFRNEHVANCVESGYINFYVSNAQRVNRGHLIYTIDDTMNEFEDYNLSENDIDNFKSRIIINNSYVTDLDFSNIYSAKDMIFSYIDELNSLKELEQYNIESDLNVKEKGFSKYAGLISFIIDGYENYKYTDFQSSFFSTYTPLHKQIKTKQVNANDSIYKIINDPEFSIVFESEFDYNILNKKNYKINFSNMNLVTNSSIESFLGADNKTYFKIDIIDFPEKFINQRVVEFEIENKKISGLKIPIKSIVSKNCFRIPKNMIEYDYNTEEHFFTKLLSNGTKKVLYCDISKEDDDYYYIAIDDFQSKVKFGDSIINRYGDNYSLSEIVELNGVYNMNKGYAVFKNIEIVDKTNEYAIVRKNTRNGISLYDQIAINATNILPGDLI